MLFSYGKQNFSYRDCYQVFRTRRIPVKGSEKGKMVEIDVATPEKERTLWFLLQEGEHISRQEEIPEVLDAPVQKGEKIGEIRYLLNDQVIRVEDVCAQENALKWSLIRCIRSIMEQYMHSYLKK